MHHAGVLASLQETERALDSSRSLLDSEKAIRKNQEKELDDLLEKLKEDEKNLDC